MIGRRIGAAVLFVLSVAVYARAFGLGFVEFDDNIYVSRNPHVSAGLTKESLTYAVTTFDSGNWIPVTWLSYLVDATLFGIRPMAFHGVNVVLHGLNAVLIFCWLHRVSHAFWRSFAVAALFAVHPLHVESVAWVAERKDVLSTFFFLAMLIAYDAYSCRPNLLRYLIVLVTYTLGLLSKSMLVTAPLVLVFVDLWLRPVPNSDGSVSETKDNRSLWWRLGEKIPLLVLAAVIGLMTVRAQGAGPTTAFTSFDRIPLIYRVGNGVNSYAWYLMKTIVPTDLCVMYSHPMLRLSWPLVGLSAVVLATISVIVGLRVRQQPMVAFGWMWYLVTLLPVIGLLQVGTQARADRYAYIPQIGLLIGLVWETDFWLQKAVAGRIVGRLALAGVLVFFSLLTIRQIGFWSDTETLWDRALAVSSDNWEAHRQFGTIRLQQQKLSEAKDHFERSLALNPKLPDLRANLGWIHQLNGEWAAAVTEYEKSLSISPGNEFAMAQMIQSLRQLKQVPTAAPYLIRYLQRHPADVNMRNQLGLIYARQGDFARAQAEFAEAVRVSPDDVSSRTNLGLALSELGRLAESRLHLEAAVSAQKDNANARVNLGSLLIRMGLAEEAKKEFEAALSLNPSDEEARAQLNRLNGKTTE